MPSVSVLIKPVSGQCNMKCEYCFYCDVAQRRDTTDFGRMSKETLEEIVRKVFAVADRSASFSFQGGEPTLRGLAFYRSFIEMQKRYNEKNIPVTNCLQTNGILINEEWARFLGENSFLVGLSLDGPREVNDKFRKLADGEGSHSKVIRAARLMKKYGVDFNILFTLTSESVKNPGKLYSFFRKNEFDFLQFMPCIDPYEGMRGRDNYSLKPQEFGNFLRKFFDRWSEEVLSGGSISVRYFDNLVSMAAGLPPEACSMRGMCSCQFIFEADGSCYPCDFYVSEEWCLGNIKDHSLQELFDSANGKAFLATGTELSAECRKCKWFPICRGGCRRDRDERTHMNYHCRAYKGFLDYAWPKINKVAAYLLRRNGTYTEKK